MVNLGGDKTDQLGNKELVKNLNSHAEMSIEEYNKIPFNIKVTFADGVICRVQGSSFSVGQLAVYYKCGYFVNGTPKLTPINVWLV